MELSNEYLFKYKGTYFVSGITTPDYLDTLEDFEIRDSDVFLVTYPKSGTVWTQNILSLIYYEGHRNGTEEIESVDRMPWLDYNLRNVDFSKRESPRLIACHLPYYLVPKGLRNGKGKVIYVLRNPKDVLVSYYHFSKFTRTLEEIDFDVLMERFLDGKVVAGSWLDHVEGWSAHRDDFNILFLTYEEMKKDLRGSVLKICNFLGKKLTEEEVDAVVDNATFDKMKKDRRANYENMESDIVDHTRGSFLRKVFGCRTIVQIPEEELLNVGFGEGPED
ncbi:amine sulfotransferase isoform X2 [Pogona vitticeps]